MSPRLTPIPNMLITRDTQDVSLADYIGSPANAFFTHIVHYWDAVNMCTRNFKRNKNGNYNKAAQDSLYRINIACFVAIMGHFETFQRFLFSGIFEATRYYETFDVGKLEKLTSQGQISITIAAAYRGERGTQIGRLIADNLSGWHDPNIVNKHFKSIVEGVDFYSKEDAKQLQILWQIRHSIAHTGGWLTAPDAQKVPELRKFADKSLFVEPRFTDGIVRRFHRIVPKAMFHLRREVKKSLSSSITQEEEDRIESLLAANSPRVGFIIKTYR